MSSLVAELDEKLRRKSRGPKGLSTERHKIFRGRMAALEPILREKKEKEGKKAERQKQKQADIRTK